MVKEGYKKYDYLVLFVLILGFIFLIQTFMFSMGKRNLDNQEVYVEIIAPAYVAIGYDVGSIDKLYLSNSLNLSTVESIRIENKNLVIKLIGKGKLSEDESKFIFSGRKVSINERIKIHGLIEAEGVVSDFGKIK